MSDHIEHACTNCGSLLHHEDKCPHLLPGCAAATIRLMAELPTPLLQEMVAAAQPQPESEVPNGPDISHGTTVNAAPQGSEPPAGAAGEDTLSLPGSRTPEQHVFEEGMLKPTCRRCGWPKDMPFHIVPVAPPPQPPGGTPEVDERRFTAYVVDSVGRRLDCDVIHYSHYAEARAALTAAEQELAAIETGTLVKLLRERLTAAEQRADGAEKERAKLGDVLEKWFPDITSPHAFPIERAIYLLRLHKLAKGDIAALTAQRDTAIRERDEAKAEVEELKEAREATAGRHGGEILRLNTNHSHRIAALGAALDAFERTERRIPQAHMAAKLVAELRAALAAKTEGGV